MRSNVSAQGNSKMTIVQRWGDDLAVRLPSTVTKQLGLREGASVTVSVEDRTLVIRKSTLADLLGGCRDDNRHETVEWGPPLGCEMF